jgi:predicted RNase H-like HicB family nuclease
MEMPYAYFEDAGWFAGYFDNFPEHLTQGETLDELEEMLKDLYECWELSKTRAHLTNI